jgi:hypothetical protein
LVPVDWAYRILRLAFVEVLFMKFDPYEYIAVIAPGTIFLVAMSLIFTEFMPIFERSISIGDFGIALIVAFIFGHLLQGLGNILEGLIWSVFGGWPTSSLTKDKTNLIDKSQLTLLRELTLNKLNIDLSNNDSNRDLPRLIYAYVKSKGNVEQIDVFNRNYGLMRGIFTSLLLCIIVYNMFSVVNWMVIALIICATFIALYRMIRFARYYAKQLCIEFISTSL